MPPSLGRAAPWLFVAGVGFGCGGSNEPADGFATLGGPPSDSMGPTAGDESGPGGADWMNVDSDERGSDAAGTGGADAGSTTAPADDDDDDDDDDMSTASAGTEGAVSETGDPAGNPFQGDYAGTAEGTCEVFGDVMGNWTITVHADGTFDGVVTVDPFGNLGFDGTVSEEGQVVTNDGDCGFLGMIDEMGGSGDFTCEAGCSGEWAGEAV